MNIDLNSESFDAKEGKVVFNGGEAGIAEPVTVSLEKKKPEDKEKSPDYKVNFTDATGAICNTSFWYVTEATSFNSIDELIAKQGKVLKHLAHAILGDQFTFLSFDSAQSMLDGVMKLIREGLPKAGQFRIFANYGTKEYSKKFIQPRSWVPFIESVSVPLENTRLIQGDLDCMVRLQADKPVENTTKTAVDEEGW